MILDWHCGANPLLIQECVTNLAQYVEMVKTTVDLDELENHQFIIKPDFDDNLRELKNALDENQEQLNEEHQRVADDLGMSTDSKVLHFENHQVYGYVFRLTRKVLICSVWPEAPLL